MSVLERPELLRLDVAHAEVVEDRLLRALVDDSIVVDLVRHATLPTVECGDDLLDARGVRSRRSPRMAAALAVLDRRHERHARVPFAGLAEIRARSDDDAVLEHRSAAASDVSPSGSANQRYIVASFPAARQPRASNAGSSTSRLRR